MRLRYPRKMDYIQTIGDRDATRTKLHLDLTRMAIVSFKLLSIFCMFVMFISHTNAQSNFLSYDCTNDKGNYTANSTYQTNLNTLLSNLSGNTEINYGFYNFSYGQNSDKVNAVGLCRGDVKLDDCRSCLNDSRILLTKLCPNQKEAIGWYDNCMLRYSNRSIFGNAEASPFFYLWNPENATDVDQFNQVLRSLMYNLTSIAVSGSSLRKFAAANASAGFQTIYGLVQCTPDLSGLKCDSCLIGAISEIPTCCDDKRGGRVVRPSCNIRYEIYRFYNPTADTPQPSLPPPPQAPPPSPSTNNTRSEGKSNRSRIVIAVVGPIVAIIVLVIFVCIYLIVRKSKKNFEDDVDDQIKTTESLQFHFNTIKVATNNFSDANKLGQGGFGFVYRGRLSNGQEIAVKRLSKGSGQGDTEFKNEVQLVAKLQHRNLVRLLGFCLEGRERILIYEFVHNKSLDYFIFDSTKRSQLDWGRRYKIIVGIARGLLYLHEDSRLTIIHRDLKASNILLDEEMNAKISDFGMAKLVVVDQTQINTSRIVGTYGYMAPEYLMHGQFSVKSDVFSCGVLILEIVTGHKNSGIRHGENIEDLLSFTWRHWREGTVSNIVDPTLNNGSRNEMLRCMHIGLLCVQENIVDRPTMATVVLMLNSYSLTLPIPSQPAFLIESRSLSNVQSREFNSRATRSSESKSILVQETKNEASITELYPR